MKQQWKTIRVSAFTAAIALTAAPAFAAPFFVPGAPATLSDVIAVQDSAKIIRRDGVRENGVWKKRFEQREARRELRRDRDARSNLYKPKSTPKYAYDADGNFRIYDGKKGDRDRWRRERWQDDRWDDWRRWDDRRWEDRGEWQDWDGWDKKHWHRPRYKMNSFGYQQPSPALKQVLTATPDGEQD